MAIFPRPPMFARSTCAVYHMLRHGCAGQLRAEHAHTKGALKVGRGRGGPLQARASPPPRLPPVRRRRSETAAAGRRPVMEEAQPPPVAKVSWRSLTMMKSAAMRTKQRLGFKMEGQGKRSERLGTGQVQMLSRGSRASSFSLKAPVSGGVSALKGLFAGSSSKAR